jgi:APA family basic amino acid/polyamine antiporter
MSETPNKLKKNLSFFSMISIACGAVIGGWLTESPYWFELTGSSCVFVFPLLAVLLIPVGLVFAEMTTMLPFASSVGVWTSNALGFGAGWASQWLMFLIEASAPSLMAYIFITVVKLFVDLTSAQTIVITCLIVVAWYVVSNFSIGITGKLANVFFVIMTVFSVAVCIYFMCSGKWDAANLTAGHASGNMFAEGFKGFAMAMAVLSLKFIGFELTPTLIEETTFPRRKMWIVILSALIVPAVLYSFVVIALGGLVPRAAFADMLIPEISIINMYGFPKILAAMALIAGLLHALTTLMSVFSSAARILYGAAELNQLPAKFKKLNKHGQPVLANTVVLIFSLFFCIFSGLSIGGWVSYFYSISSVAAGAVYFICCLDALILRKKHPDWERPYRCSGVWMFYAGMALSLWITIGSCISLGQNGIASFASLIVYGVVGLIVWLLMKSYIKKDPANREMKLLTPTDIEG